MDAIPRTHEDIEAQIREIQSKKKEIQNASNEKEQVGLGKTGFYDQDIYDGSNNKYDGYVTSIAANDEIEDEDYEPSTFSSNKRPGYNAPAALLNDVAQSEKDYDPFADRRRPTIADREDEYRQKRRRMIISPERVDPFAEGGKTPDKGSRTYTEIMREQLLKGEETELRKKLAEKAKDGTLKANGEPKPAPKKRGRWDQTDDAPTPKKPSGTTATPTSWDNADVGLRLAA